MNKIGIQGGKGSFSEDAAHEFTQNHEFEDAALKNLISSEAVLAAVENGPVDYGIFARENARRRWDGKLPGTAGVIANRSCTDLYDLAILQEDIHDPGHNLRLFLGVNKMVVQ